MVVAYKQSYTFLSKEKRHDTLAEQPKIEKQREFICCYSL